MPNTTDDELPQRQNPSPGVHVNLGQSNIVLLTVTTEKWLYVQEHPVRKGLCQRIGDWPFKGRVFDLMWTGK